MEDQNKKKKFKLQILHPNPAKAMCV